MTQPTSTASAAAGSAPTRPDAAADGAPAHALPHSPSAWRFCVAPMMDLTDRHARFFLRLLTRQARLYTEMITTGALLHGDAPRLLRFDPAEQPVAVQLGGSEPRELALCARMAEDAGYAEVNLNVGCPSDRVQSGRFGACLMAEPQLVADGVAAMRATVSIPVTVKTRIGIDRDDSVERLFTLVDRVHAAGCTTFVVHARNAWLDGLSPKENREIPPLRHGVVHALKRKRPQLDVVINGGLTTLSQCREHLQQVDGVMLGREAYYTPWLLASVDPELFGVAAPVTSPAEAIERLIPYFEREIAAGTPPAAITRHLLGLFQAVPGARAWRRTLSEEIHRPGAGVATLRKALACVTRDAAEHVTA
jgi:tRNA-dihydrouridine synthase A